MKVPAILICVLALVFSISLSSGSGERSVESAIASPETRDSLVAVAKDSTAAPDLRATSLRALLRAGFTDRNVMLTASDCIRSPCLPLRHISIDILSTSKEREFLGKLVGVYKKHYDRPEKHLMEIPPFGTVSSKQFSSAYDELTWHLVASLDSVGQLTPDLLVPLFEHENPEVKSVAIEASVPTLIEWLKDESLGRARYAAAGALGSLGDPRAVRPMLGVARDKDTSPKLVGSILRNLAVFARMDDAKQKKEMMALAYDNLAVGDWWVRAAAINLLSWSDRREDLVRLLRAYVDHHERPDSNFIRSRPVVPWENQWEMINSYYRAGLRSIGHKAPDMLDTLIGHPNPRIRLDVAGWFETAGVRVPSDVHTLRTQEGAEFRVKAASALGSEDEFRPGHKEYAISALRGALEDESPLVADAAREALLKLGASIPSD